MIESERDMFVRKLRELYYVQRQLEDLQAQLAADAVDEDVADFFRGHAEATTEQRERIETLFDAMDAERGTRESAPLEAITDEREALIEDASNVGLHALVDAETGKKIERLEISIVETLLVIGDRLDVEPEVTDPLERTRTEAENALGRLENLSLS